MLLLWRHQLNISGVAKCKMGKNLLALWFLTSQSSLFSSFIHSGRITENTTFYYRRFPVFPSKVVTIKYNITYDKYLGYPEFCFFVTENQRNLQSQCVDINYDQVRNKELCFTLIVKSLPHRERKCVAGKNHQIHCSGKITIQDYTARKFGFFIGYECHSVTKSSLQGLTFNFTAHQTNVTRCFKTSLIPRGLCGDIYDFMSLPNLMGITLDFVKEFSKKLNFVDALLLNENLVACYQHFYEAFCYLLVPKCDPFENIVIHVCRETCKEVVEACYDEALYLYNKIKNKNSRLFQRFMGIKQQIYRKTDVWNSTSEFNCGYLPSVTGSIPCFYKPVSCGDPPNITNAMAINGSSYAPSSTEYFCQDETFTMVGNKTIQCLYNGTWSELPKCIKRMKSMSPLIIVLPLFFCSVLVIFITCLVKSCKGIDHREDLTRQKDYDAFVSYSYEGEDPQFAENTLRIQLEEERQFKLCIHRRDFLAAWDIMWNINNAIKNSNSAIIVMSQDYINSLWCKEEFEQCYIEHIKDPAFKLFVIMLQPVEDLEHITVYMERLFSQKTYLTGNDPKLFPKIANYLTWVKKFKDNDHEMKIIELNDGTNEQETENEELIWFFQQF